MGFIENLFAPFSTSAQEKASADRIAAANQGYAQLADLIAQGRGALTDYSGKAAAGFSNLQPGAESAFQHYLDITGANGREGQLRAQQSYVQDPGFRPMLDTAIDAANRASVARGGAAGNNIADVTKLASNAYLQDYGNYAQRAAVAAGFAPTIESGLANVYGTTGQNLATLFQNQGTAAQNTQTAIGKAQADADLAPLEAGKNLWGALGTVGNLAASFMGSPTGSSLMKGMGGSMFSGLTGKSSFFGVPSATG